jgi:hypothetical protein
MVCVDRHTRSCLSTAYKSISGLKKQAKSANTTFSVKDFVQNEYITILLNVFPIVICLIAVDEITNKYPVVIGWLKWFFFAIGYMGSSILIAALGRTQNIINKVVDIKTDIADGAVWDLTREQSDYLYSLMNILPSGQLKSNLQSWITPPRSSVTNAELSTLLGYFASSTWYDQTQSFSSWVKGGDRPPHPHG